MLKKLSVLFMIMVFVFTFNAAKAEELKNEPVKDLSKAYEVWKNKGIKFVVRGKDGQFDTWSVGKLESWGTRSKWVVRNKKGQFLTHATGNVESWKNGSTKLVLRDKKGRILTHIKINLTDKGNFYSTAVGLRKLPNDHFLAFVQDSLGDILEAEIKAGELNKARALITYLSKYKNQTGAGNFKPVIRRMLPLIQALNSDGTNKRAQDTADSARELLAAL